MPAHGPLQTLGQPPVLQIGPDPGTDPASHLLYSFKQTGGELILGGVGGGAGGGTGGGGAAPDGAVVPGGEDFHPLEVVGKCSCPGLF